MHAHVLVHKRVQSCCTLLLPKAIACTKIVHHAGCCTTLLATTLAGYKTSKSMLPGAHLVVLHHVLWRHLDRQAIWSQGRIQHWVQVHVRHEDGLTDRRLVVQPRAAISMATSPVRSSSMAAAGQAVSMRPGCRDPRHCRSSPYQRLLTRS
jgi:hypothetical protein